MFSSALILDVKSGVVFELKPVAVTLKTGDINTIIHIIQELKRHATYFSFSLW